MGTKFGARSLRTLCDTCSEFVSGSTETSTPSTELPSQLDLKRPDDSDTRPLRASSFTESRSAEVDERSQFPRCRQGSRVHQHHRWLHPRRLEETKHPSTPTKAINIVYLALLSLKGLTLICQTFTVSSLIKKAKT